MMNTSYLLTPPCADNFFQDGALLLSDQGILPSCEEATLPLLLKRSHLVAT
jgi:hypothetical protein